MNTETSDVDAVVTGFVRLKSSLMGYRTEFGEEVGTQLMALAMKMSENAKAEGNRLPTTECAAYLAEELRAGRLKVNGLD